MEEDYSGYYGYMDVGQIEVTCNKEMMRNLEVSLSAGGIIEMQLWSSTSRERQTNIPPLCPRTTLYGNNTWSTGWTEEDSCGDVAMFDTGEWNDNLEAQTLTERLVSAQKRSAPESQPDKGALSRRKRLKRNRQLLEILQTLKSPSAQNPDLPPPPEEVPAPEKKKKRRKKVTPDQDAKKSSTPNAEEAPPPTAGARLSRKQWKNKIKNKKKNRNKFKACEKSEDAERGGARTGGAETSEGDPGQEHGGGGGKKARKDGEGRDRDRKSDSASPKVTAMEKFRIEKLKKLLKREEGRRSQSRTEDEDPAIAAGDPKLPQEESTDPSASLRSRMEQRLHSARFRYINEQLYTTESQEAARLFRSDPEAFSIYHSGFSQQVRRWPVNPLTEVIKYIKHRTPSLVVADFGCGDAQLARSVRNDVHSFDLVALNDRVTVCDIAQVPLSDESVDIAVFCLSLMGKNLSDFLQEANRVLKMEGVLLVAEVSSRFDDVRQFLTAMSQLGFKCVKKSTENSHFYLFEFSKVRSARDASKHPGLQLKPCMYKKR